MTDALVSLRRSSIDELIFDDTDGSRSLGAVALHSAARVDEPNRKGEP